MKIQKTQEKYHTDKINNPLILPENYLIKSKTNTKETSQKLHDQKFNLDLINLKMNEKDLIDSLLNLKPQDAKNNNNKKNIRKLLIRLNPNKLIEEIIESKDKFFQADFKKQVLFLNIFFQAHQELNKVSNNKLRENLGNLSIIFLKDQLANNQNLFSKEEKDSDDFYDFCDIYMNLRRLNDHNSFRKKDYYTVLNEKINWNQALSSNTHKLMRFTLTYKLDEYARGYEVKFYEERELLEKILKNLKSFYHKDRDRFEEDYLNAVLFNPTLETAVHYLGPILEEFLQKNFDINNIGENATTEKNKENGALKTIYHDNSHYLLNDPNFDADAKDKELRVALAEGMMNMLLGKTSSFWRIARSDKDTRYFYKNQVNEYQKDQLQYKELSKKEKRASIIYGIFTALNTFRHNIDKVEEKKFNQIQNNLLNIKELARLESAPTKIIVNGEETTWYELIKRDPAYFEKIILDYINRIKDKI